jgi:hypothetical protein
MRWKPYRKDSGKIISGSQSWRYNLVLATSYKPRKSSLAPRREERKV